MTLSDSLSLTLSNSISLPLTAPELSYSTADPPALLSVSCEKASEKLLHSKDDSSVEDQSSHFKSDQVNSFDFSECPKDIVKVNSLKPIYFILNNGLVFIDKLLPDPSVSLLSDLQHFTSSYYVNLHFQVKNYNTYNHLGARLPLEHSYINVNKFRSLLPSDFDDIVICQYLEYGFPLGLQEDYTLKPV